MYTIKKIYNNNVSLVDCNGIEKIVTGIRIAFKKKIGDAINEEKILEQYILEKDARIASYDEMLKNISSEEIQTMNDVINYASKALSVSFETRTKLSIIDHLYYAIKRYKEGMELKSDLLWSLKRMYKKEYQVARECISLVNRKLNVELCEEECTFLTLHFVNVTYSREESGKAMVEAGVINDILKIISDYFKVRLDEDDDRLGRFVVHLRYLIKKAYNGEAGKPVKNKALFNYYTRLYEREYECSRLIQKYILDRFKFNIDEDEILYITIHLVNLIG